MQQVSEEQKVKKLLEWAAANGSTFSKVEIRCYEKNFRGVHAACDIAANERILTVPLSMILTASMGWKASSLGARIKSSGVEVGYPYCTYVSCLLLDASKDSTHFFRPYHDIFPTDASNFPFFFAAHDLSTLQELSIAEKLKEEWHFWEEEYKRIVEKVEEFKEVGLERYVALASLLCSRNFYCQNAPEDRLVVPLAGKYLPDCRHVQLSLCEEESDLLVLCFGRTDFRHHSAEEYQ
eukprot:TRINITY_DN5790_c0_g10_i1.p1 TRINITY_DN5790_c0_g10~~TRINITY_DN5790_c0_g10_i1.p1  ORF type:complete len:237 (-),score=38.18 TRINITY_DN5790_c0_g10_i1:850-1560(-)